ncbi:MAG TPA: potassium-transporting ATPase subunit KdpC [Coriobacteriia bacterium]
MKYVWTSIRMTIVTAVIAGIIYPLVMTGLAQVAFPGKANGSLVKVNGRVVGSRLIGQDFTSAKYFQPRPSAAGKGYDAMDSSFSNLGPTNKALADRVQASVKQEMAANPELQFGSVPIDMVTTSASGLDPDITVANARAQVARVAAARGMSLPAVLALVAKNTTGRELGFLGEPHVNVLELNLALDSAQGVKAP